MKAIIVAPILLVLFAGCYVFNNPVDPDAKAYQDPASPPLAPSSLSEEFVLSGVDTQVRLSWQDNSVAEDGFHLEYRIGAGLYNPSPGSPFGAAAGEGSTVTELIGGFTGETGYTFRVAAFNSVGYSTFSNELPVTTGPIAPSGLILIPLAAYQIQLDWSDNSSTETSFLVERSTDGTNFLPEIAVPADSTTWTDAITMATPQYWYRVTARDGASGSSAASEGPVTAGP